MACGAPTITSSGSSLDEVAADAALIVPCREPDALITALQAAFFDSDLRLDLQRRGFARAGTFTWRKCAQQTLEFWQRALET
jgi:alpha-1,3-rhamnosyl/mannosyltransferase